MGRSQNKLGSIPWLVVLITAILVVFYAFFAYNLERSDFLRLISYVFGLWAMTYLLIERFSVRSSWLLILGVGLRLVFLGATPNLSQDFYRFIWDGRLLLQGINPYSFTPEFILGQANFIVAQGAELLRGMGSLNASHYSNYPPLNQVFFAIGGLFGSKSIIGSVIAMRVLVIAADIGTLFFAKKILTHLKLPTSKVWWYFLNPFLIIEFTGNLHFEGVMIFFIVAALYLLIKSKWVASAIVFGCAISLKLIPLLLLPVLFWWFVKKERLLPSFGKLTAYYLLVLATVTLSFLPFANAQLVGNFSQTIALWFQKFEFNGSIYYIIRWIGFKTIGWNIIADVGKILPIIIITVIALISLLKKRNSFPKLATGMLFAVCIYLLLSTTVHPWYIATPLILCVFTRYNFPIVWSALGFLSYSAYGPNGFDENLWLVAIEYILVIGFFIWELKTLPKASLGLQSPAL